MSLFISAWNKVSPSKTMEHWNKTCKCLIPQGNSCSMRWNKRGTLVQLHGTRFWNIVTGLVTQDLALCTPCESMFHGDGTRTLLSISRRAESLINFLAHGARTRTLAQTRNWHQNGASSGREKTRPALRRAGSGGTSLSLVG
jgi:hypothetical protein